MRPVFVFVTARAHKIYKYFFTEPTQFTTLDNSAVMGSNSIAGKHGGPASIETPHDFRSLFHRRQVDEADEPAWLVWLAGRLTDWPIMPVYWIMKAAVRRRPSILLHTLVSAWSLSSGFDAIFALQQTTQSFTLDPFST